MYVNGGGGENNEIFCLGKLFSIFVSFFFFISKNNSKYKQKGEKRGGEMKLVNFIIFM